jgi:hypothetical protein
MALLRDLPRTCLEIRQIRAIAFLLPRLRQAAVSKYVHYLEWLGWHGLAAAAGGFCRGFSDPMAFVQPSRECV